MSIIEDFALRNLYVESKNLFEIDLFTGSSFGRAQVKCDVDIEDLYAVVVPELIGLNVMEQRLLDEILLDVVEDSKIRFAFSLACAKSAASYLGLPLYQYLGGIFTMNVPVIVFGDAIVDSTFNKLSKSHKIIYQDLDTLTELSKQEKSSCIQYAEDGSWHVACGMGFDYIEIYKREDINELLRIKEHMLEVL